MFTTIHTAERPSKYFLGRDQEIALIHRVINLKGSLAITGPEGIGKTALINHSLMLARMDNPQLRCIYLDIHATHNLQEFNEVLTKAILKQVPDLKDYLNSNNFLVEENEEAFRFKELFRFIRNIGENCNITMDGIYQITMYPEKSFQELLYAELDITTNVSFLFAGRRTDKIKFMFERRCSALCNMAIVRELEAIDKKEFLKLFVGNHRTRNLSEEFFNEIYKKMNGQTGFITQVLDEYHVLKRNKSENLPAVIDELLHQYHNCFQSIYMAYTRNCRLLMKAVAAQGEAYEINSAEFIARSQIKAVGSINTSMKKLIDSEIIHLEYTTYKISNPLFMLWLNQV